MIYLALAAVLWGSSFPVITYALRDTSPMLFVTVRFALATAILAPRCKSWQQFRSILGLDVFLISVLNALSFILQFKAQELTTASKTALFVNSSPVFAVILTAVVVRERIAPRHLLATLAAMAGIVVTSTRLDFSGFEAVNLGDVLAVGVGLCWALFIVASRNIVKKHPPFDLSLGLCFWSTVIALPLVFTEPPRISWASTGPIVYLAVFTTILAYYFYLRGVQSVSPVATSIVILIEVVVAFAIAHVLLSESFSPIESAGVGLVLAGILLVVKR